MILSLKNVSYMTLIKEITFSLSAGEVIALLGPNGSGKTTLLKLISGILPSTSGSILIDNKEFYTFSRKEKSRLLSLVPQSPQVNFEFSAKDIILMGAYCQENCSHDFLDDVMERLSILHLKDRPFPYLSAGERQRCYFARSLIANTPFMLLDEPTSNQDSKGKQIILEELAALKAAGKGLLFATHDISAAEAIADRFLTMESGFGSIRESIAPL